VLGNVAGQWSAHPRNRGFAGPAILERGTDARYLLTEAHFKTPGAREYALWYGANVRTVPSLPMKLVIFDDAVVLGMDPQDPFVGAVVHHSVAVVNLAREYYESYWRRARRPVHR
jgi:hypothetical protein